MIFVALGTHHQPFDRLVDAADALAAALDERVLIQRGSTRRPTARAEVVDTLAPDAFEAALRTARVVVLHAGSSSYLQARALGRRPIVVPRRPEHGEHVDDHQVRFARALAPADAAVVDPEALLAAVVAHVESVDPAAAAAAADVRSQVFCDRFGALVAGLVRR